jgi:hypothetical protein
MKTAVETLLAVLDAGGKLAPVGGEQLRALLPPDCPPDLIDAIRTNKGGLLALLSGPRFTVVRAEVIQPELLLWVDTDRDRDFLISLGASPETVYTRDELATFARTNPTPQALALMHRSKALFGGRFLPPSVTGR